MIYKCKVVWIILEDLHTMPWHPPIKWNVDQEFLLNKYVPDTHLPFIWKKSTITRTSKAYSSKFYSSGERIPKVSFPKEEDILFYKGIPQLPKAEEKTSFSERSKDKHL